MRPDRRKELLLLRAALLTARRTLDACHALEAESVARLKERIDYTAELRERQRRFGARP